jgi:hypothetical protein
VAADRVTRARDGGVAAEALLDNCERSGTAALMAVINATLAGPAVCPSWCVRRWSRC